MTNNQPSRRRTPKPICPDLHRYEAEKLAWDSTHPAATCSERDAAMQKIAKRCGV